MNNPSKDGWYVDCLDMAFAGEGCKISYQMVLDAAKAKYPDNQDRQQNYIEHKASGIFNEAFYLLSSQWVKSPQARPEERLKNTYAEV